LQVAGPLQIVRGVRVAFAPIVAPIVVIAIASAGCFYTDPINQRPSDGIEQLTDTQVFRGQLVNLTGSADDPNGDDIDFEWRGYACSDATAQPDGTRPGCDGSPVVSSSTKQFAFDVPDNRQDGVTPVRAMYVTLDATDTSGATAPQRWLVIPVADAPPTLALAAEQRPSYVKGIPVPIYAKVGDPDDTPSNVAVVWTAFSPTGSESLTTEQTEPVGSGQLQLATTLLPDQLGVWTVQAIATDPSGVSTTQSIDVVAAPDAPPCLTTWSPIAPPPGESLPISMATLFEVLVVTDDLDPYPAVTGNPYFGTTTFSWSLMPPGGTTHEPISATGAGVALDPASYQPGDIVELRVEIYDRNHTDIPCDESDPTCSIGANSCLQRLTWRVEMQ
jgi:hypothetical protein